MKKITFDNPHRKKHFDFFNAMNHPHFSISGNVDISKLIPFLKSNRLPVTPCIVFLISKAANDIPQFRWRIRNNEVVEHQKVSPSFTVPTDESEAFSFCTVEYTPNAEDFIQNAARTIESMRINPSFEDDDNRDDYLFLSAIPWISFTSIQHAMYYHPSDSVPRISWGKFFGQDDRLLMPLSVQAHHALLDGKHIGAYFETFEKMAANPKKYLST